MKALGYKCKSFDARLPAFPISLLPLSLPLYLPLSLLRSSLSPLLQHAHLSECNAVHCRHNTVFYATSSGGSRRHFFSPTNEILRIRPVDCAASAAAAAAFSAAFPLSLRQQVLRAAFQFHCQRAKRRKRENETSQRNEQAAGRERKWAKKSEKKNREEGEGRGEVGRKSR